MSRGRKYVTAVVAGAMTAGIGAASVPVQQDDETADVDLAANSITIPILNIDTPPPVSIIRQILLTLGYGTNQIYALTSSTEGTAYDLPGLHTDFSTSGGRNLTFLRSPGNSIGTVLTSVFTDDNEWSLLDFVNSEDFQTRSSGFNIQALTGGVQGIGAALSGALSNGSESRSFSVGDIFDANSTSGGPLDGLSGQAAFAPWDAAVAIGNVIPIARSGGSTIRLGSVQALTGLGTTVDGMGGLCLGSATANCGYISQVGGDVILNGSLALQTIGKPPANVVSYNLPNTLVAQVKPGQFSVEGTVGGKVTVGNLSIGRVIPVDIEIPRASSMLSSMTTSRQQSVRDSFMAVPRKSASDNETGGRHRATPLRDAVGTIKKAVNDAVSGKHAAKDSED